MGRALSENSSLVLDSESSIEIILKNSVKVGSKRAIAVPEYHTQKINKIKGIWSSGLGSVLGDDSLFAVIIFIGCPLLLLFDHPRRY